MRMSKDAGLLCAALAAAILLPISQGYTQAQYPECIEGTVAFNPDGVTTVKGSTREGKPCRIWFGRFARLFEHTLTANPAHGTVSWNASALTRHYVLYTPRPGFVGTDYFQFTVVFAPKDGDPRHKGQIGIDMTVTAD